MDYEHTQSGPVLAAIPLMLASMSAVPAVISGDAGMIAATVVFVVVAIVVHAMSRLTTTVTADTITVAFRWGRPRRVIARDRVVRAEVVRNKWWHGWGIRLVDSATMYNVWGLDAVLIELDGPRGFRIGTDDPHPLAAAINDTGTGAGTSVDDRA